MRPQIEVGQRKGSMPEEVETRAKDVLKIIERNRGKWHQERTPSQLNAIIPLIRGKSQEYFDELRPFKKRGESWDSAKNDAWETASHTALEVGRSYYWTFYYDCAASSLPLGDFDYNDLALTAAIETVSDQKGITNPFIPRLMLYVLGAERISFRMVQEPGQEGPREMLVMNFPLILPRQRHISGVLFREDGKRGDPALNYIVDDADYDYHALRPLMPPKQILPY